MDVTTGKIKVFESDDELQKAMHTGNWVQLARLPNPNCKRCYGRGHVGRDVSTGLYVPCRCVKQGGSCRFENEKKKRLSGG